MSRMRALDALFLYAEDGVSHMHIGSCAVFSGPAPTTRQLAALIDSKLHLVPRFRQIVRFVPGQIGHPVWVDDAQFDLANHLGRIRLGRDGGEPALLEQMAALMSDELDRQRPLWHMWIVTGLPGDEWAIVSKAHHCLADGVSGTDLMAAILDVSPAPARTPRQDWAPAPAPTDAELVIDAVRGQVTQVVGSLRSIGSVVRSPGAALDRARLTTSGLAAFGRQLTSTGSVLPVAGHLGAQRSYAVGRCRLADVQRVRRAFGGSVNDVVLTAITGAFHDLIAASGAVDPDATLPSLVPVSVRAGGDHTANNQVSMMIAPLPVGVADASDRLAAVQATMARLKASHEVTAGAELFDLADVLPAPAFALLVRTTAAVLQERQQRVVSTVTTNVAGPSFPLFALGREMREYLPFVPLGPGVRIGIAILSYHGGLAFGVSGDEGTAHEVRDVARSIESGIVQLTQLAHRSGRSQ